MDNSQKLRTEVRRFSQSREQDIFKISEGALLNEDFSNNKYPQQVKDVNFLSVYYNKKSEKGNFMEKISKLNKKFFNFSNKYVKSKKTVEKLNDVLYLNLFDQINCYVEEIERLNIKITSNNNQELKKTIDQLKKEILEQKEKIRNYENKIKEKINNEEKLKKEIESYKRSLIFYKDKIKIGILTRNRNSMNPLENETSYLCFEKKTKIHNNNLSPTFISKKHKLLKNKTYKDLNLKLDSEIYNKKKNIENKEEENDINIINSEEKTKKFKNNFKLKESIYKVDRESHFFENRTDYDIYGKDIEEKEDEYNNNFELIRPREKSKTIKTNSIDLNPEENSQKFSSGLLNDLTEELYGSPENICKITIENDSNKDVSSFNKKINSESVSGKKERNNVEKEEKRKTLNIDKKGKKTNYKMKKMNKNNENKSGNINPKYKNLSNNFKSNKINNKMNLKNENERNDNNTKKIKQAKTATKSKPENYKKNKDEIPSLSEVHTPYIKNKLKKQFDKDKEKEKNNFNLNEVQSNIDSKPALFFNRNILLSNQSKENKKNEVNKLMEYNNFEENKYFKLKRKNNDSNINSGYNSMSNLNYISKYNASSKASIYRKNQKENNTELTSVLKDVNDDYLKSIEMLRKQEEQIKFMLRFIDLDDEK